MDSVRSLPVIMPQVAGQRWSCHGCGDCCRTLVGHLFDEEHRVIEEQGWSEKLGVSATVRVGRDWVLNKRSDGACVFLDDDDRCRIHSEFGEEAKPLACRIFPFSVREVENGWQASLRFDCPSVVSSMGEPIGQRRAWLAELASKLPRRFEGRSKRVFLHRGLAATVEEEEAFAQRIGRWIGDEKVSLSVRLLGAARLTTTLAQANLKLVRGSRFAELLDTLIGSLASESRIVPHSASRRQNSMLRQLVFAHAEHVSLLQRRRGLVSRLGKRFNQLHKARRFHRGRGLVPKVMGLKGSVKFEALETIESSGDDSIAIEELITRYLVARVSGRSFFGPGYYDWNMVDGLAGLCLSMAVVGWLSRYSAAAAFHEKFLLADVGFALGVMDRAATRLPAPGSFAERARVAYLLQNDGLARLMSQFKVWG